MNPATRPDPRLCAALRLLLEQWREAGVESWAPAAPGAAPASAPAAPAFPEEDAALAAVAAAVAACRSCRLCETRTRTVPGEGPSRARVMFIGEAPGADEDRSGRPFVGRAGQLLTKIIENGMGLRRDQVYIGNVLKCRPPDNRDPQPDEKTACAPFLETQIATVRPELIIALGRHAASHLLGSETTLSRSRGRIHQRLNGPPVLVTYHPAFLLRNPGAKKDCWEDIQVGMRYLGLEPPARPQAQAS